jgi:hypothetical protein
MADNLFSCQPTLANYERAEILKQFSLVAQATAGQLDPQALRLSKQRQVLISNVHWQRFRGEVVLQRSWTVLVTVCLFLPKAIAGQMRLSNVYGETSGTPLAGPPRLEANWSQDDLIELFPLPTYQVLAGTPEPFSLLLEARQVCLTTYRFYPSNFYLRACSFLAEVAQRAMDIGPQLTYPVRTQQIELPWI